MKRRGSNCALDKVRYRCDGRVQRLETTDRQSQTKPNGVVDRLPVEPLAKCSKSCWSWSDDGVLAGRASSLLSRHSPVMPPSTAAFPATGYPATLPMLLCVSPVHL